MEGTMWVFMLITLNAAGVMEFDCARFETRTQCEVRSFQTEAFANKGLYSSHQITLCRETPTVELYKLCKPWETFKAKHFKEKL